MNSILVTSAVCKKPFRFDTGFFLGKPLTETHIPEPLPKALEPFSVQPKVFTYRVRQQARSLPLGEILYFESRVRKIEILTPQGREVCYGKLNNVEASIHTATFLRIHHSFLVNLEAVEKWNDDGILVKGGYWLPISQRRKKETLRILNEYRRSLGGKEETT